MPNSLFNVTHISSTIWDGFQRLTQLPASSSEVKLPHEEPTNTEDHISYENSSKESESDAQTTTDNLADAKRETQSKSSGLY